MIVFHGGADHTVTALNGEDLISQSDPDAALTKSVEAGQSRDGRAFTRALYRDARGRTRLEHWFAPGLGHAWSGRRSRRLQCRGARSRRQRRDGAVFLRAHAAPDPNRSGARGLRGATNLSSRARVTTTWRAPRSLCCLIAALSAPILSARAQERAAPLGVAVAAMDQRDAGASDPRRDWLDKVEASRRRSTAFVEGARAASILELGAPRPLTIRRRVRGFLDDPTLRPGDAVMTSRGLRLFAGAVGPSHGAADFEALERFQGPRGPHWLELTAAQDAR